MWACHAAAAQLVQASRHARLACARIGTSCGPQGNASNPALVYAASRSLVALRAFRGNVLPMSQALVQQLTSPHRFAQEQAARQLWELGAPAFTLPSQGGGCPPGSTAAAIPSQGQAAWQLRMLGLHSCIASGCPARAPQGCEALPRMSQAGRCSWPGCMQAALRGRDVPQSSLCLLRPLLALPGWACMRALQARHSCCAQLVPECLLCTFSRRAHSLRPPGRRLRPLLHCRFAGGPA